LSDKVHAVGAVESNDGPRLSALATCVHLASAGVDPILHLLTRDMNRIAIQATILGALSLGVHNIFCTAGRHQILTNEPHARGVFDVDSLQLVGIANGMRNGVLAGGREIQPQPQLILGTDTNPYAQPMELQILSLEKAVAQGVDFVVTQPVFKLEEFATWLSLARERGICSRTCILPSVKPLTSAGEAADLRETHKAFDIPEQLISGLKDSKDPRATGIEHVVHTISEIRKMEGIRGLYLMTGEDPSLAVEIMAASGLSRGS